MLGVVTVTLALAIALLGAWVLSTDVTERETTVFNPLADVTPLFEGTMAPEYIDYSPSTNYTGYYTDNSIINNKIYTDGINYDSSTKVNPYRLNPMPVIIESDTVMLDDYAADYPFDDEDTRVVFAWVEDGVARSHTTSTSTVVTLSSFVNSVVTGTDANSFTLKSLANISPEDMEYGQDANADWVLITTRAAWEESGSSYNCVVGTPEYIAKMGYTPGTIAQDGRQINVPFLSVSVDINQGSANVYADADCTEIIANYSLSDLILVYGGTNTTSQLGIYINFAESAAIEALKVEIVYMDPSKGVELDE